MVGNDRPEVAKPNRSAFLLPESSRTKELGLEHLGFEQEIETGYWENAKQKDHIIGAPAYLHDPYSIS